ncbi:TetR/AcrR family transcriptional regulator [Cupriavidus sp. 2MCAB6]|uniref:TetR/AcrR family transcriptional regulator n=1 Tax=Cupriavidus sp. 2MCAB6 TaxID=3232981 RepID=UPI003F8F3B0F
MARPREFDEQQVLEAAGDAFWANGFEATSTRDLVKCTGLTQPSLYNAFGDKRGLFLRALEHYLERTLHERIARLESSQTPGHAIASFFGEIVDRSVADARHRGCMLVNAAVESTPGDAACRQGIAGELAQIQAFFQRCMEAGQASGEVPTVLPAADAGAHLLAVLLGVRVLARVRPERALLTGAVSPALSLLGLPPLPVAASTA